MRTAGVRPGDTVIVAGAGGVGLSAVDELISARYRLEDITAGYADLAAGRNARGLIAFMAS